jgi:dTDP-4-amino-4,6-dideoxygalactose transaminase
MGEKGIQTDIHYPLLDCDQMGLPAGAGTDKLVQTRISVEEIVTIPLFPELTEQEVARICEALSDFCASL